MKIVQSFFTLLFLFISLNTFAQNQEPTIAVQKISDNIYMLVGNGGNIGVSIGDDGVFIIDDKYAPLTEKNCCSHKNSK